MSNATRRLAGELTAYDFRINGTPELELFNDLGEMVASLPLDGERYRIQAGENGAMRVSQELVDSEMFHHHCFILDPEFQGFAAPGGGKAATENNLFRFRFAEEPSVDGQTSGALVGIGAVDILDISILGDIVGDERRPFPKGRPRPGSTGPNSTVWPEDFPECHAPRVELTYKYPLGPIAGDPSGRSYCLQIGAVVEETPRGKHKVQLVISCEKGGAQLQAMLEE